MRDLEKEREHNREYMRKWRKANPEKVKAYSKKWRESNPEYHKEWEKEHPEKKREYWRKHYEKNKEWERGRKKYPLKHPEKAREATKKYRESHPEKVREAAKKYREAHLVHSKAYQQNNEANWNKFLKLAGLLTCAICGSNQGICFHHPYDKNEGINKLKYRPIEGGLEELKKTVPLCRRCHGKLKGKRFYSQHNQTIVDFYDTQQNRDFSKELRETQWN